MFQYDDYLDSQDFSSYEEEDILVRMALAIYIICKYSNVIRERKTSFEYQKPLILAFKTSFPTTKYPL